MTDVEQAAQCIYEHWRFGAWVGGEKPAWDKHGNSVMQEMARAFARVATKSVVEAHDATKAEFSQIASSALAFYQRAGEGDCKTAKALSRFILPEPVDPLVAEADRLQLDWVASGNDSIHDLLLVALKRGITIQEQQP